MVTASRTQGWLAAAGFVRHPASTQGHQFSEAAAARLVVRVRLTVAVRPGRRVEGSQMEESDSIVISDDDEDKDAGSMHGRSKEINENEPVEISVSDYNGMVFECLKKKMMEYWKAKETQEMPCCPRNGRNAVLGRYKRAIKTLPVKIFSLDDLPEEFYGFGPVGLEEVRVAFKQAMHCFASEKLFFSFISWRKFLRNSKNTKLVTLARFGFFNSFFCCLRM